MTPTQKTWLSRTAVLGLCCAIGWYGWQYFHRGESDGAFVQGNGRIEATEVDVAAKAPGRVAEIRVNEGDFVKNGEVVARMDVRVLEAQLAQAQAQLANAQSARETTRALVVQRRADVATAEAMLTLRQSELEVAKRTGQRSQALLADRAISAQQVDEDLARVRNAEAAVRAARAQIEAAKAAVGATEAQVQQGGAGVDAASAAMDRLRVELDDGVLVAPRDGRVQYRIVQPGEVVGGGGKVVSLVDVSDVYMTFFLPEQAAGRVALGSEVRIVLDAARQFVIPAKVSYVASVAQFTPKTVETRNERQKMAFRVKARIDPELLRKYPEQVKTGLPGVAHLRLDANAEWPPELTVKLP